MAESADWIAWTRSAIFALGFVLSTIFWAAASMFSAPLPFRARYAFITGWCDFNVWWLKFTCGVDYRVEGRENIPAGPCIIMANHQSAWETLALKHLFPPAAWVLKRELLWVPFFGWGLALLRPIALNRGTGRKAVEQLLTQARKRLAQGRWIMMFPEGTRVAPGSTARYKLGGAIVAAETGVPVVPVGHNSGVYWPRRRFVKRPGMIVVRIGTPVDTKGKSAEAISAEVKRCVETLREDLRPRAA
jgi:1-acyl-sn-glycerol-3-phosphate acyltransferase